MLRKFILPLIFVAYACTALAQSQLELDGIAAADSDRADKQLNKTYEQLVSKRKKDTLFLEKLKKAQRAWMVYRDAMLDLQFPVGEHQDTGTLYGSGYPMCLSLTQKEITNRQNALLSQWLKNSHPTDMCSGSKDADYNQ